MSANLYKDPPSGPNIVFFDGVCNLCNSSINWILKRDKNGKFRYASLQSDFAKEFLIDKKLALSDPPESIYLLHDNKLFEKSQAVFVILKLLNFPWPIISSILQVIPKRISDACYDYIALNRYKWTGKSSTCRVPSKEEAPLFLE